jgi:hypothetical protein
LAGGEYLSGKFRLPTFFAEGFLAWRSASRSLKTLTHP